MERFLFVLVLLASNAALDAAFAKGGVLHLFVAHTASASQLPSPSQFLAGCGHGPYRDRVTDAKV
jgi:hypothetical protein